MPYPTDAPLDHYYLELRNNCYAVVAGNRHYRHLYIGYIKYCSTSKKTIWFKNGRYYRRIVEKYDPLIVHKASQTKQFIPYYGGEIPVIPVSSVARIYNPLERIDEIITHPQDILEEKALDLIEDIMYSSRIHGGIGLTGSILIGIHNPQISDIDLVVYGWRNSINVIEAVEEGATNLKPFRNYRLKAWLERNAAATGLTVKQVAKYYRVWRRGVYRGKEYSIIYNDGIPQGFNGEDPWISRGIIRVEGILCGGLDGLNYPSRVCIENYRVLEGYVDSPIVEIISFEALYIPLFYEGGKAIVEGLLQYNNVRDVYRIMVGVVEYPGRIIWVG